MKHMSTIIEALRGLAHEVRGLGWRAGEIIEIIGLTNWNVLQGKANEAFAALEKEGETQITDYPEADATDAAHPAWWRGHEYTTLMFCQKVNEILDGKDDGRGFNYEPWHSLRRRLLTLSTPKTQVTDEMVERGADAAFHCTCRDCSGKIHTALQAALSPSIIKHTDRKP